MERMANVADDNGPGLGPRLGRLHRRILRAVPQLDRIGCALYDPGEDVLKTFIHSTFSGQALKGYEFRLADSPSLRGLASTGDRRVLDDLPAALSPDRPHSAWLLAEGYRSSFTVPMRDRGAFIGFLFFDSRQPRAFSADAQQTLAFFADLITLLVSNELLAVRALVGSVGVARAFCDLRDFETGAHLERMSRYARLIARDLAADTGASDEFVEMVFLFSPLHDVGKIGIPDRILLKPGPLENDEWETMKSHVARGCAIVDKLVDDLSLRHLPGIDVLRRIVEYHHECLDGSGYPKGARGEAVPLEARITTVADVYDALTSPRPYKEAWPTERAFDELDRMAAAGKHDPRCVAALRRRAPDVESIRARFLDP